MAIQRIMRKALTLLSFCFALLLNYASGQVRDAKKDLSSQSSGLTYQIINSTEDTFGYNIYDGSKKLIHQTTIPGQPGTKGFHTRLDAEKVAALVINKFRDGASLPTVTFEELKKLGVIK